MADEKSGEGLQGLSVPPVEPWPEPVDGKVLLDAIRAWLVRFVVLPKWVAETVVLWIVHTYVFELRNVATYLGLESPAKGSRSAGWRRNWSGTG